MALLSPTRCSQILGVALFGYAVLLIFIPKHFWGLYFDNIEDCAPPAGPRGRLSALSTCHSKSRLYDDFPRTHGR